MPTTDALPETPETLLQGDPDRVDAPPAPTRLREQQFALSRHLRDPDGQAAPAGIADRRLAIYRELLFNNLEALLAGNFPVIRALLGEARWQRLVRAFYRDHRCRTPLFPEIAEEFLRFVQTRAEGDNDADPPFLAELAHYEWVELALEISEASAHDVDHVALGAGGAGPGQQLLDGAPVVSPLAWPLAYRWPVHRLGPDHAPGLPPDAPTLLLLRREREPNPSAGSVRFSELSPLTFRLLQRLAESPALSGRAQLLALAQEAGASDVPALVADGAKLLEQLHASGVLLGIRRPRPAT